MTFLKSWAAGLVGLGLSAAVAPALADCSGGVVPINSARYESVGEITVKAGTGCAFNITTPGAVQETKIVQMPKVGRAGVRGLTPLYAAKPGYSGPDEFAYAFIGTDQYGGPMNIVIKWKITVTP